MNLIVNSSEAIAGTGEINITVKHVVRYQPGDSVPLACAQLTVRDNGIGVDPARASGIFDMFARLDREIDGIGVGLTVCRRIVEAHGGRIWVEPAEGGGSAFRFTLPATRLDRAP